MLTECLITDNGPVQQFNFEIRNIVYFIEPYKFGLKWTWFFFIVMII